MKECEQNIFFKDAFKGTSKWYEINILINYYRIAERKYKRVAANLLLKSKNGCESSTAAENKQTRLANFLYSRYNTFLLEHVSNVFKLIFESSVFFYGDAFELLYVVIAGRLWITRTRAMRRFLRRA